MTELFEVRWEHIKLLKNAVVRWEDCEYGAPAIDCKRPYGNSSVRDDIAEILDWSSISKEDARKFHEETLTALQIFLQTGTMERGHYVREGYGEWERDE